MAIVTDEGSVTWITVGYDGKAREWAARLEGVERRYPVDRCASAATAARKALRAAYLEEGLHVKVDRLETHKHFNRDLWDFKALYHVR